MKGVVALLFPLLMAIRLLGATNEAAVKLAVVPESPDAAAAADVLAADLSKHDGVQLLERAEIEKVYRELALSGGRNDCLKLGQVLGADGLLLLSVAPGSGQRMLDLQLVAVKPGVRLLDEAFAEPTTQLLEWSAGVARQMGPFLPKLRLLARDAIPISVVNLRSSLETEAARELERQMTLLTLQRLSREKQVFVLERQHLQMLASEKAATGLDESAFWNGSYLLDGTLDGDGYSKDTITISAQLASSQRGILARIEARGSRTNLGEVVNQLVDKIMAGVRPGGESSPWNAADEAERFYGEARWAMKWNLYPQAQAAGESAWALGRQDADTARLLVHAYSDNVPLGSESVDFTPTTSADSCIRAEAVPDPESLRAVTRALEVFHQNSDLLLDDTNAKVSGAELGVQLLGRASGVLESYYYAAEARAGNEDGLDGLRAATRLVASDLGAHPFPTARDVGWETPQQALDWLKWEEGGLWYEQPEAALPMFRQLLESGYHPGHLPRLVGWSWESRQRAPQLLHQIVTGGCANTNAGVRLEGLFLALLLAPDDEQGSRQKSENELLAAIWENRGLLYTNLDFLSLVERTHDVLRPMYDDGEATAYFSHEPFASFKHRLRMDYLAWAVEARRAIFLALFSGAQEPGETPEQARELLSQAASCEPRLGSPPWLQGFVAEWQREAGTASKQPVPVQPAQPAAEVLKVGFIPWDLRRPDIGGGRQPHFAGMKCRAGRLWLQVRYCGPNAYELMGVAAAPTTYIAVDVGSGLQEEIPFPARLGMPGDLFEVSSNALFVVADRHLYCHKFAGEGWEEIAVPLEGASQLVWARDRLLIGRNDGLLEVQQDSKQVRLLVSSRRQPAATEIDPLWASAVKLFPWSDGRLGMISGEHCLTLNGPGGQWTVRSITNLIMNAAARCFYPGYRFASGNGAEWFLTGPVPHRYLVGFWADDGPAESLLAEPTGFGAGPRGHEPPALQAVRWDWPQSYPLESSCITAGDRQLWVLAPRKVYTQPGPAQEPVNFSDGRDATLFYFESTLRQPLTVPLHLEAERLAEVSPGNGHAVPPQNPFVHSFMEIMQSRLSAEGNAGVFWLETPAGLVLGGPACCGHWLIPRTTLESRFKVQRQMMGRQSNRTATSTESRPPL